MSTTTVESTVILDLPWNVSEIWAEQQRDIEAWFENFRSKPAVEVETPAPVGWDIIETTVPAEPLQVPVSEEVPAPVKKKKVSSKKKKS